MEWIDPLWIAISGLAAVSGVLLGVWRRLTPTAIAMDVGGTLMFLWGARWAAHLGGEAALAAALASVGAILFTLPYRGGRHGEGDTKAA